MVLTAELAAAEHLPKPGMHPVNLFLVGLSRAGAQPGRVHIRQRCLPAIFDALDPCLLSFLGASGGGA
jgi:hypothetical protein